jgi:hypothetical protein
MLHNQLRLVVPTATTQVGHVTHRALLVLETPRLVNAVSRVMRASNIEVETLEGPSDVPSRLEQSDRCVVVCDSAAVKRVGAGWLSRIAESQAAPAVILLSEQQDPLGLSEVLETNANVNIVAKANEIDSGDLLVTVRKLVENDIFGIEKYLRWGSIIHSYMVNTSKERREMLDRLEAFLYDLRCRPVLASRMLTVADEFITNALYNAPIDEDGHALYASQPRNRPVSLPLDKAADLQFGSDGRYLAIGCWDPFGSLDPMRVRTALARCLRKGPDQVAQEGGGAGIGLYMVFQYMRELVVNVAPGRATEFIGIVDMTLNSRSFCEQARSLNVFVRR